MPEEASEVILPWPSNYIGALLYGFGKELQYLDGAPYTILRENFLPGETTALVISTLGFPSGGTVAGDGYQLTYAGKTDDTLPGITGNRALAIPINTQLALLSHLILPPVYNKNPNAITVTLDPP